MSCFYNVSRRCSLYCFTVLWLLVPGVQADVAVDNAWDLPSVVLPDLQDRQQNLYDWHGRVILLNFWASWCGPCQAEIPHLIDWQRQYADAGLQVIGIGIDEPEPLRNIVRTFRIDYPVFYARPAEHPYLLRQWGDPAGVLPYTVVIDRDGRIRFSQTGLLEAETFADYVLPLLTTQPRPAASATASPPAAFEPARSR
jgi:thiol-disulfide isomerase/thioredoxin